MYRYLLVREQSDVGFFVFGIKGYGRIKIIPIGINPRIQISKRVVVVRTMMVGVIGAKSIHLQGEDERNRPFPAKGLAIDIEATSK